MIELLEKFKKEDSYSKMTKLQKEVVLNIFHGRNILLTGPAGTGKSFTLTAIFDFLEREGVYFAKTAMTGVAALNIGGSTLHSWAGIGLAEEAPEQLVSTVRRHKSAKDRIKAAKILFVDEISMASAELLDKLDFVLRFFRKSVRSFGGIQVVFVGDFLQLPPVFKQWNRVVLENYAFDSKAWKNAKIKIIHLTEIMRQSDSGFSNMLNKIRVGDTSDLELLKSRIDYVFPNDGIEPVRIYCKNIDVNQYNRSRLSSLKTNSRVYIADEFGSKHHIEFFNKNCPAPQALELREGAQVMLLVNHDSMFGLVNGSVGIIQKLETGQVEVKFTNGHTSIIKPHKWELKEEYIAIDGKVKMKVVACRKQIPLKLAWATTVHKQQGSTIDRAEVDVTEAFACGQVYVALSRVRDINSLSVKPFSANAIQVDKRCLDFYNGGIEL